MIWAFDGSMEFDRFRAPRFSAAALERELAAAFDRHTLYFMAVRGSNEEQAGRDNRAHGRAASIE